MNPTLFFIVFIAYIMFMILLSWWVSKANESGQDFLLGGRQVAGFLTLGTTVATMVGTGSSMGAVGFAYTNGWAGTLYGIGGAIGILLLAYIYAPIRRLEFVTMSEEISYYVGADSLVKGIVAILIFVASIGWLGAHIIGGALYLGWITGIELNLAKLIVAFAFGIYVIVGGYVAVVWTDTIQAVVLFIGFLLMAILSVQIVGGWEALIAAQPDSNSSFLSVDKIGVIPAVSLSAAILVGIMATPSYRQRIYSAKSVSTVRKSFTMAGGLYLAFSIIPAIIGMAAYAIDPSLDEAPFAFPYLAITVLPVTIGIVVLVAGLSATMSSASSDAIAAVTILLRDLSLPFGRRLKLLKTAEGSSLKTAEGSSSLFIYEPLRALAEGSLSKTAEGSSLKTAEGSLHKTAEGSITKNMIASSRIGLALIIVLALLLALLSNDIIGYITSMISTVMSGLFVCGLLGKYWQRFNRYGALGALLAGSTTSLTVIASDSLTTAFGNPILPSVGTSLAIGVLVTLLTPASTVSMLEAQSILKKQRSQVKMD